LSRVGAAHTTHLIRVVPYLLIIETFQNARSRNNGNNPLPSSGV
jgi:hypothetical protein